MDDSTTSAVLAEVQAEVAALLECVRSLGARVLEAGLVARAAERGAAGGTGPTCPCGTRLWSEGVRPKEVQTLVGWITLRRTYYRCRSCGPRQTPLDGPLGVARDSHSPGVRRLTSRLGALLPFAQAAATLAETAGVQLSPSTVRGVTEALGTAREGAITAQVATAWAAGWPPTTRTPPDRAYVAMDGVRILSTDGTGREAKLGMVVPVQRTPAGRGARSRPLCGQLRSGRRVRAAPGGGRP